MSAEETVGRFTEGLGSSNGRALGVYRVAGWTGLCELSGAYLCSPSAVQ